VTGANGHIGSHIVRKLIQRGKQVRALVRPASDLRSLAGLDVDLIRGDVLEAESMEEAFEGCHVVFHTAAVYALWARDESVILRTAIEGSTNVISACARAGVRKIIYTSSVAAVGFSDSPRRLKTEHDYNEDTSVPAYVTAKTVSEKTAKEIARRLGVKMVVVNPTLVLGPGDYKPTPSNIMVKQFVKLGSPFYYDGGANVVDVEDVAEGHILAEEKGRDGERYILGGENITVRELMNSLADITGRAKPRFKIGRATAIAAGFALGAVARVTGKPPLFTSRNARTFIGRYGYFETAKAESELGFTFRPCSEVLERAVEWFKTQN
jgi:dihydroflavonol-4-reductase